MAEVGLLTFFTSGPESESLDAPVSPVMVKTVGLFVNRFWTQNQPKARSRKIKRMMKVSFTLACQEFLLSQVDTTLEYPLKICCV